MSSTYRSNYLYLAHIVLLASMWQVVSADDFTERCSQPGVIKCVSFDEPADIVGTWVDTWIEAGVVNTETAVFNANGTVFITEREGGVIVDSFTVNWNVANNVLTLSLPGIFFDAWVFTSSGQKVYTEEASWSVSPDLSTRDGAKEGEIWTGNYVKQ